MIFYYSATGNSKYAAEKLLSVTGGQLYSISACEKQSKFNFTLAEGEKLGFVFPVFCCTVPMTVRDFVKSIIITGNKDTYSYVVATCGESTGKACKLFSKIRSVNAVFGLPMVDNYLPFQCSVPTNDEIKIKLNRSDSILNEIISHISAEDTGSFNRFEGKNSGIISKISNAAYVKGRSTRDFSVTDNCTGCGLCEHICPTSAIKINDGKPAWVLKQCDQCFACIHRCPSNAIDYKHSTIGKGQYVNPRTVL